MRLTHREIEKNHLVSAAFIAQRKLASGLQLNLPEATAVLAGQILFFARKGYTVSKLMDEGRRMLGLKQVMPGVAAVLSEVQVEATFPDGTKLVTLHSPICLESGELQLALAGSCLPLPDPRSFEAYNIIDLVPGELLPQEGVIHINAGREYVELTVLNTSDRPIQVGSHFPFVEANRYLKFDRLTAYGKRLNIAAGTSVRFEAGQEKTVSLVSLGGHRRVFGCNSVCNGSVALSNAELLQRLLDGGFLNSEQHEDEREGSSKRRRLELQAYTGLPLDRKLYARMYGPTTGDMLRLADTDLYICIEHDFTVYGDECKFGGGKVVRDGLGQGCAVRPAIASSERVPQETPAPYRFKHATYERPSGSLSYRDVVDTVLVNATILDCTGIYKADIGIIDGMISHIGKAGNEDTMDGVTMLLGVQTEVIAAEGLIVTAGAIDTHVHYICPQLCDEALAAGITTLIGGGTGPASGTCATTCTPGPAHMEMMMRATDGIPLNFGFTGKGNASAAGAVGLEEIIKAGAVGLKLHEDWGTTPSAIDSCLSVADRFDVQVTIHTDTLNESACVEHTIAAIKGRTIHSYHTEGAGGGHAPDIITVAGLPNVIPSSTNPTRPFTINTIAEHLDMLLVCHHLDHSIPEDLAFAESRIREHTIMAEDILHDLGAISIVSSDSQAMGRIGEVIIRTWQTAHKMKVQRGQLMQGLEAHGFNHNTKADNFRAKRYVSKYTINPAIAHGMAHLIGSIEVGKLADLVVWNPAFFGVKPQLVLKAGEIVYAAMGDANASIPTPEPVQMRPMFGALHSAPHHNSVLFVSQSASKADIGKRLGLSKRIEPIYHTRTIGKADMVLNDSTPEITVDPETYLVMADGEALQCEPLDCLPMAQLYFMH